MIRTICALLCKMEKALITHLTQQFKLKMSMHSDSFNCVLHNYVLSDVVLDKYSSDFFVTIVSLNNIYITKKFSKSTLFSKFLDQNEKNSIKMTENRHF